MPTLIVLFDPKPGRPSGAPETLRRVPAQFREFADGPTLIPTERI